MRARLLFPCVASLLVGFAGCGGYEPAGDGGGTVTWGEDPAQQGATAPQDSAAERRLVDNLKRIGLAMHRHHDAHKSAPPQAICDQDGNPLLSWRVALLPYVRLQGGGSLKALYDQFHLDEPWDSPHNSQLIKQMPQVYSCGDGSSGTTSIMVFVGEGTPFGEPKAPRLADIRDGTTNTIFCVVAGPDKAAPWTKPEDLSFDPNDPLASLGQIPGDAFPAAFFDGSVKPILKSIDPDVLRRVVCHRDGEPFVFSR